MARTTRDRAVVDEWDATFEVLRSLVIVLFLVVNVLNLAAIVDGRFGHEGIRWVLLDGEGNPSTWFASALWLVAAFGALVVGIYEPTQRTFWRVLAATLAVLSMEEVAQIHERVSGNLGAALDDGGPVTAVWVIPGFILAVAWAVLMVRLAPKIDRQVLVPLVVGGVLFVVGSMGLELLVGQLYTGFEDDHRPAQLIATAEENFEMVAAILVTNTLVQHARALIRGGGSP